MFYWFLILNAHKHVTIANESKGPLNSYTPFKSTDHQLLYNAFMDRMAKEAVYNHFLKALAVIYDYMSTLKRQKHRKISIVELKLLFATYNPQNIPSGPLNICKLDHVNNFDDDIIYYLDILQTYKKGIVFESARKQIKNYMFHDYNINKCISYVYQAFATSKIDSIMFDKEQNEVGKSTINYPDQYTPDTIYRYYSVIESECQACTFTTVHFALEDAFSNSIAYQNAIKSMQKDKSTNIDINIIYTKLDIYKAARTLAKRAKKEREFKTNTVKDFREYFSQNVHFNFLYDTFEAILQQIRVESIKIWCRDPMKYEMFFNEKGEVSADYSLENWKADTLETIEKMTIVNQIIKNYIFLLNVKYSLYHKYSKVIKCLMLLLMCVPYAVFFLFICSYCGLL